MPPSSTRASDQTPQDREAAEWFARLGATSVTTDALRDFRTWRRVPANDAAYRRLERRWAEMGRLRDDPQIQAALQAARGRGAVRRGLPGRRAAWGAGLGVAAAAAVAAGVIITDPFAPAYATAVGEQRLVPLADGSRLRLNTDSRVEVAFRRGERRVRLLRGQAFFEVAHDPSRPFVVDAGDTDVRALGTRFDVRREAAGVRVLLVEGSVRVRREDAPQAWTLRPSEQLVVTRTAAVRSVTPDAARATSWTTGRLVFRATPLAEAVAEVNRYAARKVELDAGAVARRPVNGDFEAGDTEAFVQAVAMLFDLEAVTAPDGAVRLRAKAPPAG